MLPPSALLALSRFSFRELAENMRLRAEEGSLADHRQLGGKFLVFRKVSGRQVELTRGLERQSHPGAHQLTRQAEPAEPEGRASVLMTQASCEILSAGLADGGASIE